MEPTSARLETAALGWRPAGVAETAADFGRNVMHPSSTPSGERAAADVSFLILYRPGPNWVEGKPITEQPLGPHRDYLEKLFAVGRVAFAGPFLDAAGGGVVVVRASEAAVAARILADDPAVRSGVLVGEVRPWYPLFDSAPSAADHLELRRVRANVDSVRRLFCAVEARGEAGDPAARWQVYQEAYAPGVVIHEAPSLPYGGDYAGPDAVARHAASFLDAWIGLQAGDAQALEPTFLAAGDLVAVLWRQRAHDPQSGECFDMPAVSVYRMRDGRVADSRMFHFDAAAVRGFLERARGTAAPPGPRREPDARGGGSP